MFIKSSNRRFRQFRSYQFQSHFLCHCPSRKFLRIYHPLKYPQHRLGRSVQPIQYHLLLSTHFHRFMVHELLDLEHFSKFLQHNLLLCNATSMQIHRVEAMINLLLYSFVYFFRTYQLSVHWHSYILYFHITHIHRLKPVEKCNYLLHLDAEWQLKIFHFFLTPFSSVIFLYEKS